MPFIRMVSPQHIIDNMQIALNTLFDYFVKWKIKINAKESQSIFLTKKEVLVIFLTQILWVV